MNQNFSEIGKCCKCHKKFYGLAGLLGYKLCIDCAIIIGEMAKKIKAYTESLQKNIG